MAIANIQVQGMTCQHCVQAVKTAVNAVRGVETSEVYLPDGLVTIHFADGCDDVQQLLDETRQAIIEQGYDVIEE